MTLTRMRASVHLSNAAQSMPRTGLGLPVSIWQRREHLATREKVPIYLFVLPVQSFGSSVTNTMTRLRGNSLCTYGTFAVSTLLTQPRLRPRGCYHGIHREGDC